MDHIVDFDYLEGFGAKIVALNDTVFRTVQDFSKRMGQGSVVMFSPVDMDGDGVLRLRRSKAPLLYLHGKGMYHNFFAISTMVKVRRRTRYAAHMRHMALRVVKDAFPDGFYAFHIRMGDSASRFEKDGTVFVALAIAQRWKLKKLPVYVATEPTRDAKFFAPIERSMKAVFSDNLNEDLIAEFKNEWPKGTIRVDMLGILEQLLCAVRVFFCFAWEMGQFNSEANAAARPGTGHTTDSKPSALSARGPQPFQHILPLCASFKARRFPKCSSSRRAKATRSAWTWV